MGIDEQVCPVCGQPVATVVRRHKTLGAWVPVWSPGPCRNHECAAYVDAAVEAEEAEEAAAEKPRAGGTYCLTGRSPETGGLPPGSVSAGVGEPAARP
ncbi:hypothetical protein, partial [Streptomyces scabiei]|uniref:hypothetical protein n=1 Tax=Streptomyces scabiei TaxID=1930 RepID=UPI0029BE0816